MSVAEDIKEEQRTLVSLSSHPGWLYLKRWMEAEYNRAIQIMMDERRREDSLKAWAREAKTYQKIIQRVQSAVNQQKREPF